MSICGATDTPVLDFWWYLLWVSKPEWVLPYSHLAEAYVIYIHSLRFTSGATPLPYYNASIAASRLPTYLKYNLYSSNSISAINYSIQFNYSFKLESQ